jgi:phosphoribosylpyrophosphate synthetase
MQKVIVLTATSSFAVAARLLARPGTICGVIQHETFPDGEVHHQLLTPVDNKEAVVVGNFDFADPDSTLALFDVASLLAEEGALGLTLLTPQNKSKSRQTRFLRRVQARMLTAIPDTPLGNRLLPVDEQTMAMPFYGETSTRRWSSKKLSRQAAVDLFDYRGKPVLFATKSYGYMAEQFQALGEFEAGVCLRDKETGIISGVEGVTGRDVVIIGGTIDNAETLDLYVLANAVFEAGALSMTIVIPYFGYSTMERGKPELHEAVKAAYRARLISSIPACPLGNSVVLTDLHSEGIPHYFHGVRTIHVYAVKRIIM